MMAQLPIAGIVFALDGVLLGAGDAAFMRTATVVSRWWAFAADLVVAGIRRGLVGIWSGLSAFVGLRLTFVGLRTLSGRWVVTRAA